MQLCPMVRRLGLAETAPPGQVTGCWAARHWGSRCQEPAGPACGWGVHGLHAPARLPAAGSVRAQAAPGGILAGAGRPTGDGTGAFGASVADRVPPRPLPCPGQQSLVSGRRPNFSPLNTSAVLALQPAPRSGLHSQWSARDSSEGQGREVTGTLRGSPPRGHGGWRPLAATLTPALRSAASATTGCEPGGRRVLLGGCPRPMQRSQRGRDAPRSAGPAEGSGVAPSRGKRMGNCLCPTSTEHIVK